MACKILVLHEEKKISLKADHFDALGNSPYDGAASLSQIRDTCYGNRVSHIGQCPYIFRWTESLKKLLKKGLKKVTELKKESKK